MRLSMLFLLIMNLFCSTLYSQKYRNTKAYINDFGKSELYVKEALMEYSKSIIDASLDNRVENTLERIYIKLDNINVILLKHDIGIHGDISLRDEFIKLNNKTSALLKNKSLKLNDYSIQSNLSYDVIFDNFSKKENEISNYYADIIYYENFKKQFGLKYNLIIRNYNSKNVFEYNAYQNLIFYKLNVLDEKLTQLFYFRNADKVDECIAYMDRIIKESLFKTNAIKNDYEDQSLNEINIELIGFFQHQNTTLQTIYTHYIEAYTSFQKEKNLFEETDNVEKIASYNEKVRNYNAIKNTFFDTLYANQIAKKELLEKWYITNSLFLKNNIIFEDVYEKFVDDKK